MEQYLTVKEFSEKAGISQQAVYKQLDGRLKEYVKLIGSHKTISDAALKMFYGTQEEVEQPIRQPNTTQQGDNSTSFKPIQPKIEQDDSTVVQPDSTVVQPKVEEWKEKIAELEQLLAAIQQEAKSEKEFLKEQIRQKDKQIEALTDNLRLAQQLAAADKKRVMELENRAQESEEVIITESETDDLTENPPAVPPEKKQKQNIWARWFKK